MRRFPARTAAIPAIVAVATAVARAAAGAATEEPPDLGEIHEWTLPVVEVRATPMPDPLGPFPLATTRLDSTDVARRPGGDLGELLAPVAGLRVAAWGDGSSGSTVSVRGSSANQVLLLVDGRRWQTAQGGGADLALLPLDSVESVEVYRGGASALWGADAIGGAIHVRTRRPVPGQARLRVAGGSHGERSLSGGGALALGGDWTMRADGRAFSTDGDAPFEDDGATGTITNGDLRRLTADLRAEGSLGHLGRLRFDASSLDGERGVPGSVEFPTPTARLDDEHRAVAARWTRGGVQRWQRALDVSWQTRTRRYREPDAPFGSVHDRHRNDRTRVEASLDRIGDRTSIRFAAGAARDALDSTTDGNRDRDAFDVRARSLVDLRLASRSVRVMFAARFDRVRDFDPFLAPRIGLLADLVPGRLVARSSAGLAWRAPSFDEVFWPARATAAGNPDLSPERGRDVDAGLSLSGLPLALHASVDGFARDVNDLIQWVPGASGVWRPHNVGAARILGLEASTGLALPLPGGRRLELDAGATLLRSEDRSGEPNVDGRDLVYRPRRTGTASARLVDRHLGELETTLRAIGDVYVTRANTKTLPGYTVLDFHYRRDLGPHAALDAGLANATDEAARDFRDFPLPGRTWTLGLTLRRNP